MDVNRPFAGYCLHTVIEWIPEIATYSINPV